MFFKSKVIDNMADKSKENNVEIPQEEWIWVKGFKGTDANMQCMNYQYSIGGQDDILDDVELCHSGFHLCLKLKDVFNYYPIRNGNRFFEVEALVKKSDADNYGQSTYSHGILDDRHDKIAARSIRFVRELSDEEIFQPIIRVSDWDQGYKKLARTIGIDSADFVRKTKIIVDLGYSQPFAAYVVSHNKFDIALAVGSEPELSMDMKVYTIFNNK